MHLWGPGFRPLAHFASFGVVLGCAARQNSSKMGPKNEKNWRAPNVTLDHPGCQNMRFWPIFELHQGRFDPQHALYVPRTITIEPFLNQKEVDSGAQTGCTRFAQGVSGPFCGQFGPFWRPVGPKNC